jgi:hypothetical protein
MERYRFKIMVGNGVVDLKSIQEKRFSSVLSLEYNKVTPGTPAMSPDFDPDGSYFTPNIDEFFGFESNGQRNKSILFQFFASLVLPFYDDSKRILWITGPGGSGKSVLSEFLSGTLSKRGEKSCIDLREMGKLFAMSVIKESFLNITYYSGIAESSSKYLKNILPILYGQPVLCRKKYRDNELFYPKTRFIFESPLPVPERIGTFTTTINLSTPVKRDMDLISKLNKDRASFVKSVLFLSSQMI